MDIQRSEDLPYTHPQPIRSFTVAINDNTLYLISAGGEGLIRTWRLNNATGTFESLAVLEGHTRGVTAILLQGERMAVAF